MLTLSLIAVLAGCGGTKTTTETVTVEAAGRTTSGQATPTRSHAKARAHTHARQARQRNARQYVPCDDNIEVRRPSTTCAFAQNAFYEYFKAGGGRQLDVYSPAASTFFATTCSTGAVRVVCRTSDGGVVRFSRRAVDIYDEDQAATYAATHEIGPAKPDPDSGVDDYGDSASYGSPPAETSDEEYPPLDRRIPNFDNGTGYVVQCADGMYSQSGGRPGACSGHGGVG